MNIAISQSSNPQTFKFSGLNINNVADNAIVGLPAKWRITRAVFYDASTTLLTSIAVIGLFTAASAGGNSLMTSVVSGLTAANIAIDQTLLLGTTYQTASTIFLRPTTAHGSAATLSFAMTIIDLS